jgi:hypothetical protein
LLIEIAAPGWAVGDFKVVAIGPKGKWQSEIYVFLDSCSAFSKGTVDDTNAPIIRDNDAGAAGAHTRAGLAQNPGVTRARLSR